MGGHLIAAADPLTPVAPAALAERLRLDDALARAGRQYRHLLALDTAAARRQKTTLPYCTGSDFGPAAVRHSQHFVRAWYAIFDFDHLADHALSPADVKARLATDARILLAFTSPSGDGVKAIIRFARPLTDAGRFRATYLAAAQELTHRHHLPAGALDSRTHDPARACFLSHDPALYFAPGAQAVDPDTYADALELALLHPARPAAARATATAEGPASATADVDASEPAPAALGPSATDLDALLAELRPVRPAPLRLGVEVPACLLDLADRLGPAAAARGLVVRAIAPIRFGQQVQLAVGSRAGAAFGEVNVFWGQRGFTFVKTTRRGSDGRVAEIAARLLAELLLPDTAAAATATPGTAGTAPAPEDDAAVRCAFMT